MRKGRQWWMKNDRRCEWRRGYIILEEDDILEKMDVHLENFHSFKNKGMFLSMPLDI